MPNKDSIQHWLEKFQKKYSVDFQYNLSKLADELIGNNFGDIETFALTIMRRHVLSLPDGNVKDFVKEELEYLKFNVIRNDN